VRERVDHAVQHGRVDRLLGCEHCALSAQGDAFLLLGQRVRRCHRLQTAHSDPHAAHNLELEVA
jgi:hypothetical protein